MNRIPILSAGILTAMLLTSCVAPAKQTGEKDANGNKVEYVYYTPTGSNIPVKVRKDQLPSSNNVDASRNRTVVDANLSGGASTPKSPAGN